MESPVHTNSIVYLSNQSKSKRVLALSILGGMALVAVVISILTGPVEIPISAIWQGLKRSFGADPNAMSGSSAIVSVIRLPRVFLGVCVGAALQGLFRNPLVDPGLIGVSSGGALGASIWLIFGPTLTFIPDFLMIFALPAFAFLGSLFAMVLVYQIGSRRGHVSVAAMLLSGIAINALSAAALGFLVFVSDDTQLRSINFWTLGSLGGAIWTKIWPSMLVMALASALILRDAKNLNLFAVGEVDAKHLGCDTAKLKRRMIMLPAMTTAAAVSVSGIIGFIGLVAPHLIRLMVGTDHRLVLPGAALLGVILILTADILARIAVSPAELPLGIITSLVGAPFFIWLLARYKGWMP
jgi:iron complex transport system permease protein